MSEVLYTSSSPWGQGRVIWLDVTKVQDESLLHWALYPLWLDSFPESSMLPIAAWQSLSELMLSKLPTGYHLYGRAIPQQPKNLWPLKCFYF